VARCTCQYLQYLREVLEADSCVDVRSFVERHLRRSEALSTAVVECRHHLHLNVLHALKFIVVAVRAVR